MLDFGEHIGSLLEDLVSLRLFAFRLERRCRMESVLAFILKVAHRAPHLEYFAKLHTEHQYWKRIGGKWAKCDETEFPSLSFLTTTLQTFVDDT